MKTSTLQPTKRIEYIDALRGLTMILVVFSHVELFSFHVDKPTFINQLFISFRMPLFFFVSGFIAYKANIVWNIQTWWQMSKKKLLVQLVPTFIFGLIFTYAYYGADFHTFISVTGKLGYWFTIVLLEIFLIVYTTNTILYSPFPNTHRKRIIIALIVLSVLFYLLKFALKISAPLNEIGNILSLHYTFNYFQYFTFGYICSMHRKDFHKLLQNKYTTTTIIIIYTLLFCTRWYYISTHISDSIDIWKMLDTLIEAAMGYFGILIVYNTFRTYQDNFSCNTFIGSSLQRIGKRTLDIYLLQGFLIPYLPPLGSIFNDSRNLVIELTIGLTISIIIIIVCMGISNILRTSPILAKYLFGTKNK